MARLRRRQPSVPAANPPEATLPPLPDQISHNQPDQIAQPDQFAAAAGNPRTSDHRHTFAISTLNELRSIFAALARHRFARSVQNSLVPARLPCARFVVIFAVSLNSSGVRLYIRNFKALVLASQTSGARFVTHLQHKVALLFGAGLYGFCLLAGFRGRIIASVIMFGCISHVISQVAWGRLHRSFLARLQRVLSGG